jgi:cell division protein FtsL
MNEFIDKEEAAEKEKVKSKQAKKAEKRAKPNAFVQILNGEFLIKDFVINNLGFVFFLILIMLLLVGKGYHDRQLTKDIETAQKKIDATTAEYVEAKAKLEEETKRSELVDKLGPRGLKETTNPAKVIRVKKED